MFSRVFNAERVFFGEQFSAQVKLYLHFLSLICYKNLTPPEDLLKEDPGDGDRVDHWLSVSCMGS